MNLATTTKPEKAVKSFVRIEGAQELLLIYERGKSNDGQSGLRELHGHYWRRSMMITEERAELFNE